MNESNKSQWECHHYHNMHFVCSETNSNVLANCHFIQFILKLNQLMAQHALKEYMSPAAFHAIALHQKTSTITRNRDTVYTFWSILVKECVHI